MSSEFIFANEPDNNEHHNQANQEPWKILIVDDEREVHAVTRLALMDLQFEGRGLQFLSAYSRHEAEQLVLQHPDLAIVLLDVVMDTDDAGLMVARFIREQAKNQSSRIILRTGQPGQAPERAVVMNYDINDYKAKTELTAQKLFTCVMSSLRSYRDIMQVVAKQQQLQFELEFYRNWLAEHQPETAVKIATAYRQLAD
ncbi:MULTISPECIES: response regulator [Pseudidiomarina]|uniref:Response regulator receiver domain-containing protein n=2 Tax=Pseudidiomarina TaxID=2800384 RepID=A0A368VAE0_9GAMM|nr:response regulator [Idiomarina sp. FeN1]NCU56164.1 response regulator [Idiomarina sp. FenA--70]NCU59183.1 response regulator [Idiomarina sp. FenBw--71]PWW15999.1 response regulator receiver domain-containing protein [Pseudidiomarina maritima]RBP93491.1 response regulator receiver domain-containing protein [Pseudidiomarina tainanensis]